MKTLTSESLYDLIDTQFKNNKSFVITERDIQKQLMDIITENPDVGDIIKDNGLDIKLPPGPPPGAAPAAAAPAVAPAAAASPDAAMSLLPVWASTRPPPAAAATMPPMASVPQGGRPVPYRLNPESIEALQQASERYFGRLGPPSRPALPSSQPQVIDIMMDEAPVLREDRAKELTDRLYDHIINIARGLPLDTLINFQKFYEDNDLNVGIKDVHGYIDRDDVMEI